MTVEPTVPLAFLAGFVSFISPCVLPLVPAYVGYMSGHATNAAAGETRGKFSTFLHGVFFVLGFTIFFVGFGLLTAAASSFLNDIGIDIPTILTRLGGVAVILFGLYVMKFLDPVFAAGLKLSETMKTNASLALAFSLVAGVILFAYFFWVFEAIPYAGLAFLLTLALFRKPLQQATSVGDFWYRAISSVQNALVSDTRNIEISSKGNGFFGSLGIGIVFAAGWTPCIGPIYGSVLTLASESAVDGGSLLPAAGMLTAYSLGLGVPFLVTALALNQMTGVMKGLKRNMRKVEYASGALLILIGVMILTGSLEELSRRFGSDGEFGELSVLLEACTAGVAEGRIEAASWTSCVAGDAPKLDDRIVFASVKTVATGLTTDLNIAQTDENEPPSTGDESSQRIFTVDPDFDAESVPVGLNIGDRAPEIVSMTPDGEPIALSDFAGDVVLINFWATWCGPCRIEMPEFQAVYDQLNDQGFTIFAVDFLEPAEQVTEFAEEIGISFPLVMDESGEINDSYRINSYPTSLIIDGHGVIVARHSGPFSGEQLLEVIENIQTGG